MPDSRFDNIGWALLTTFQLVTAENWNNVMYSGMAATSPAAALWFIATIIIGNYVLLNLFLAVLLENFGSGAGSPATSGNGGTSRSNSSGSTLAAAAKAALLLSWMKDVLETSWIAKLVHGPNHDNRIHALGRGPGTRSGEDWGDSAADDPRCFQDAAVPSAAKHVSVPAAALHAAAAADTSVHHSALSEARGESPALRRADLESEPSAWTAQGSFTLGTAVSPRGMPDTRRCVVRLHAAPMLVFAASIADCMYAQCMLAGKALQVTIQTNSNQFALQVCCPRGASQGAQPAAGC